MQAVHTGRRRRRCCRSLLLITIIMRVCANRTRFQGRRRRGAAAIIIRFCQKAPYYTPYLIVRYTHAGTPLYARTILPYTHNNNTTAYNISIRRYAWVLPMGINLIIVKYTVHVAAAYIINILLTRY